MLKSWKTPKDRRRGDEFLQLQWNQGREKLKLPSPELPEKKGETGNWSRSVSNHLPVAHTHFREVAFPWNHGFIWDSSTALLSRVEKLLPRFTLTRTHTHTSTRWKWSDAFTDLTDVSLTAGTTEKCRGFYAIRVRKRPIGSERRTQAFFIAKKYLNVY